MTAVATDSLEELRADATSVVDLGVQACAAYGRDDLADRLRAAGRALADPTVHVVVVGEFKQGKSSLVNALIGADACPVDDDVATAVPTYLRHGTEPSAELIYDGDPPRREPVALSDIRRWVVEDDPSAAADRPVAGADQDRPAGLEVRVPRELLAGGLVLVDTPGVGGLGSAHATASLAASSMADAVLFVTDAAQELTHSEREFLRQARQMCPTVICVLTKTDFYPAWRKIRDLNSGHLQAEWTDTDEAQGPPVVAVSSALRRQALTANDSELNRESGFGDLVGVLRERVTGGAVQRLATGAAASVVSVCDQLESHFAAERAALADPEQARRVVDQLTAVKERAEALKSAAAKWSQTLADGVADLTSDIDHDLRGRIREVITEADSAIEDGDPADSWPEMQSWLESRVAAEMLANYTLLRDRATALSEQVGTHFREASGEIRQQLPVPNPTPLATSVRSDHNVDLAKMGLGKQAMVALKAAYGGAIMFVMMGVLTGVTLGPLALGIGVVMGRKGLREEKQRQRQARQAEARNAVRRYCDQVSFVMGKDSRDTLRRIQRELRDHYTALAEQLQRSNQEALQAATEASEQSRAARDKRLRDLDAEIARLRELRERAEEIAARGASA